jgi:hypothetical protein
MHAQKSLGTLLLVSSLILIGMTGRAAGQERTGAGQERSGTPNAVLQWNTIATRLLLDPGPILEARAFAILHAAIHDAVNGVDRRYQPYTADVSMPGASLDAAVATAAHDVLVAFSTDRRADVEAEYAAALGRIPDGPAKEVGVSLGRECARGNLDRRADDGIVMVNEPVYVPSGEPGDYDFTPPFDAPPLGPAALFPGVGRITPFVIDIAKHHVRGPDRLASERYARDFNLLKSIGRIDSTRRTPDQTEIAFFWYEEPNFKWNRIANALIRQHHLDEWRAARVLALLNFAINDAGIVVMNAKYQFRFWRPYTAIRRAAEDDNPSTEADEEWQPLFSTPPFLIPPIPEYPSGLAALGAAAAEVLIRHFGDRHDLEITSSTLPGVTRRFKRLSDAAKENGMSRVYGGIHFLNSVRDGYRQGKGVGSVVSELLPRARRQHSPRLPTPVAER